MQPEKTKIQVGGCAVIIPTYNGMKSLPHCYEALKNNYDYSKVLIIDSESNDGSDKISAEAGFDLVRINKMDFDHGKTRQMAADLLRDYQILIYLTQDAVLCSPDSIQKLIAAFQEPSVGAAYGRQLPRNNATPIEAHARLFNYPDKSQTRTIADAPKYGIKTAFISNSFAAYRTQALFSVGGFPNKVIISEDMIVAARMLQKGWKIAYVADSCVYHSHKYSYWQEMRRYYDIGVLHRDQNWILREYGKPEGEGGRYIRSEMAYLFKHAPQLIPSSLLRTFLKYLGYKLGNHYHLLPTFIRRSLSMNRGYWR